MTDKRILVENLAIKAENVAGEKYRSTVCTTTRYFFIVEVDAELTSICDKKSFLLSTEKVRNYNRVGMARTP